MFGNKMETVEKAIEKKNEKKLLKLMDDRDKQVVLAAMRGIGKVGSDDGLNTLISLLHSPDDDIRAAAASALGEMGNGHAKAHLSHQMANEANENVKKSIAGALSQIRDYS